MPEMYHDNGDGKGRALTDCGRAQMMKMLSDKRSLEAWGDMAKVEPLPANYIAQALANVQPIPESAWNESALAIALSAIQDSHGREPFLPNQKKD